MPYRSDGRTDEERAVEASELAAVVEAAKLRFRAAAGKLRELERRLDEDRRALDAAVAEADDATRRAMHLSLAKSERPAGPRVRDALRTGGAVNALERAMARAKKRAPSAKLATLEEAREQLREARQRRAWLAARRESSLEAARARLADAVAAHDEAVGALEAARAPRV